MELKSSISLVGGGLTRFKLNRVLKVVAAVLVLASFFLPWAEYFSMVATITYHGYSLPLPYNALAIISSMLALLVLESRISRGIYGLGLVLSGVMLIPPLGFMISKLSLLLVPPGRSIIMGTYPEIGLYLAIFSCIFLIALGTYDLLGRFRKAKTVVG